MSEYLFWFSVVLIVYPYIIYPAVLWVFTKWKKVRVRPNADFSGSIAIVCSVYNEEKVIAEKIKNFYSLETPSAELYLGLDGCTDKTLIEINRVVVDERVKVFVYQRGGKVRVLNALLSEVHQSLVVMTDANSMFKADAVNKIVSHMRKGIGVVCGRLVLVDKNGYSGESVYWRFETLIKNFESKFGSVVGANGAIYLFRRELFQVLPVNTINDDFSISMKIYQDGYEIVYADNAIAEEQQITTDNEEFRRHVRDAAGHFRALVYLKSLLNPLQGKKFFFYVSHRVLRWFGPFFFIINLLVNFQLALHHVGWRNLFFAQLCGYTLILSVHISGTRWKPLYVPYYFMLINFAILVGFLKNLFGFQKASWDSTRRQ